MGRAFASAHQNPFMRALCFSLFLASPVLAQVEVQKWSGDLNVPDPVACTVDPQGRVYVTSTTRRKAADLDIRQHPMWIEDDVSLTIQRFEMTSLHLIKFRGVPF